MPGIVIDGLKAYQKSGSKAALAIWLKESPMETGDYSTSVNMDGLLSRIEKSYGKMIGFEPVRTVNLSPSVCRVYLVLRFEKGPAFASFDCYKSKEAWTIPSLDIHTKASQVFPPGLIGGSSQ